MKKDDVNVNEYVNSLLPEDLSFLAGRLKQRLGGDMADVAKVLAKYYEIDKWLSTAKSGTEWFDMIELIDRAIREKLDGKSSKHSSMGVFA